MGNANQRRLADLPLPPSGLADLLPSLPSSDVAPALLSRCRSSLPCTGLCSGLHLQPHPPFPLPQPHVEQPGPSLPHQPSVAPYCPRGIKAPASGQGWGGVISWLSQRISQVALGKFLSLFVPQSPHLYMGIRAAPRVM